MAAMRYSFLDNLRGLTFISMAVYHATWDIVNIFGVQITWFASPLGYLWQQSILWTFVLLSGFCCGLSRRQLKRGGTVFAAGALVTLATAAAMPQDAVYFGVLSFLGAAMVITALAKPLLKRAPAWPALIICIALFAVTRDIPFGYLGFEQLHIAKLPSELYANWITTAFGFQFAGFSSTDYVPFIPWIFLYLAGFFIFRVFPRKEQQCDAGTANSGSGNTSASSIDGNSNAKPILALPNQRPWPIVSFVGKHCLGFYLVHQVAIFGILSAVFTLASR